MVQSPFGHLPQIIYGTSTVSDGAIKNEQGFNEAAIVGFAQKHSFTPSQMIFMKQIHSGSVAVVSDTKEKIIYDIDALVTNKQNIVLSVLTADCLPIVFFDPKQKVIAVVHAGYKGILQGIIQHTIQTMSREFMVEPKDTIVSIGPGIGKCCYNVDAARANEFKKLFPDSPKIIEEREDELFLDLGKVAEVVLASEQIPVARITRSSVCTRDAKDEYFSYRRGNNQQRMVTVIGML